MKEIDEIKELRAKELESNVIHYNQHVDNKDTNNNKVPNKIFNIGFGKPILINYFIELLEDNLSIKAIKKVHCF